MVGGWVRPRRHKYRRLLRVHGRGAAAALRVCMTAVGGTHARVPKVGKIGGDMVVAGP
jgi:hypothetical protein